MHARQPVLLHDGRSGRIVRVDTSFPRRATVVSVWTGDRSGGPSVAKVALEAVVGPARVA